jgi:diacylglycerol O-acyltransferase/trehalose O-mycolyltransferase
MLRLGLIILAAIAALAMPASAAANETSCAADPPPQPSPRIARIQVEGLYVNVLLPAGYASSGARRYPVLYLLHALNYNENTWLDLSDVEKFTAGFQGDQEAIVVMPDGGPMGWYTNWPDRSEQWETYHLGRLIPAIDAGFRTLADRRHRAVAGFSMGGYGALLYAARRPDLFSVAGGFSALADITVPQAPYDGPPNAETRRGAGSPRPAYGGPPPPEYRTPDDSKSGCDNGSKQWGDGAEDVNWHARNPADLALNMRGQTVYLASGDGTPCDPSDLTDRPSFIEQGDAGALVMSRDFFAPAARAAHAHVVTDFYGCGVHTMKYAERDLHHFWPLMTKAFGVRRPKTFDYRAVDRDFTVWGWTFHADRNRAAEFLELRGVSRRGFKVSGSGTETIVTPRLFKRGRRVAVKGALPRVAVAGKGGRLRLRVDLGAAHTQDQFSSGSSQPSFVTRNVRLRPRR